MRKVIDLVLVAVVIAGGVLAWRAGRDRVILAAHHRRLVAAAGELPVEDPKLVYLRALDTGDPLHFAWRIHLPASTSLDVRCQTNGGGTMDSWSVSAPMDFIARVRLREIEKGRVDVYAKLANTSGQWNLDDGGLARLVLSHANELEVEQLGRPGSATLDPNAKQPTALLRVSLPESLRDRPSRDRTGPRSPMLVELVVGPPGALP